MKLTDAVQPQQRFARSINVERDTTASAVESYLPTGRAIDVVRRLARSLEEASGGRAFSITGPHGSGKSSLAVFLSGLLAPLNSEEFKVAYETLAVIEPATAKGLVERRSRFDTSGRGFIRAVVTAKREPVIASVARAFALGASRFFGPDTTNPVPESWADPAVGSRLTPREIKEQLDALTRHAPVFLLIDEFGKNLEAYADSGRDGDPFLLQELAEWTSGPEAAPLTVFTMQHLAFEEYVHETSTARRREWVKVQGRFEDIAYVETATQSRRLIASAFTHKNGPLAKAVQGWATSNAPVYSKAGVRELLDDGPAAYPLHPIVLAALPELCTRYGQNERTLFSFLAGPEPQAVPAFLSLQKWKPKDPLPFVRLNDVYDYFVASASTMISSAATGSRWVEIESRIRDTTGLTGLQLRTLKSVGVLNLISAGGTLRASKQVLALALADSGVTDQAVAAALQELESRGLITYRDFADEYRIWQGSDFDLKGAVEAARRRCSTRSLDELLNDAAPATALVAGRHSQQYATLRIFERRFSNLKPEDLVPSPAQSRWDGTILLSVVDNIPDLAPTPNAKPVVVVVAKDVEQVRDAALDAAALAETLSSADGADADWVAKRELIERFTAAQQRLQEEITKVYEAPGATWRLLGSELSFTADRGPSRTLSDIADVVYCDSPRIPNEMLSRKELTSQGAKARRLLIEAMLTRPTSPRLGIEGFPAERAMYEAVLARPGLHQVAKNGSASFQEPYDPAFAAVWDVISDELARAATERVNILDIWRRLQAPPIGLKDGPIPVLLIVALLLRQDDIAVYEHGTLLLAIDDAVAERLVRNPGHFAVKNTGADSASRKAAVTKLAERLNYTSYNGTPTFLGVARRLFAQLRSLEPYSLTTKTVSASTDAMRKAFRSAAEPDRLLFHDLPAVFGLAPIPAGRNVKAAHIDAFVAALGTAIDELQGAYPELLKTVEVELAKALSEPQDGLRRYFSVHARPLVDSVLEPRLKAFVLAACQDERDDLEWLENLAMIVADAPAPKSWNDDVVERFRLAATELGGAFRRVNALITERRAIDNEQAVDMVPIAVTRVDGREGRLVLWASSNEKQAAAPHVEQVLSELASKVGSIEKARQVLLASLLDDRSDAVAERQETSKGVKGGKHG
jgi:hypothetical protein